MINFLPSKKFIYIILSVIIAVVLVSQVFNLVKKETPPKNTIVLNKGNQLEVASEFTNKDTDGDGLKDWEEYLWKTDFQKTDTDGDGTDDYSETQSNRNPLIANKNKSGVPSDEINQLVLEEKKKTEEEFSQLNETAKMSRVLFSQYIAAKSEGNLSNSDKQIILGTAMGMIKDQPINQYDEKSIKLASDNSLSTVKNYGNELGKAFFTGTKQEKVEDEMVVLNRVIRYEKEEDIKGLDAIIEAYSNTIVKLEEIKVPSDVVQYHLQFVNDIYNLRNSLIRMRNMFSDPLNAIGGLKVYQDSTTNILKDLISFKNYFDKKGIVYKSGDYGFYITSII